MIDPDTVRDLLKEQNLTLEKAIDTCWVMESAKKELHSRPGTFASALDSTLSESVSVASLENPSSESVNVVSRYKQSTKGKGGHVSTPAELGSCGGCGQAAHAEGRRAACPAFKSVCSNCGKVGHYHKVCRQKTRNPSAGHTKELPPQTNSLCVSGPRQIGAARIRCPSMMSLNHADPAPTLAVHIQALNGQATVEVLPDSGADVSAAGVDFLAHFSEHIHNLLPSDVKPRAVNGNILSPIGSLKVVISIGSRSVEDHFHIYRSVSGALLSWRTAQSLGILPPKYPEPLPEKPESPSVSSVQSVDTSRPQVLGHTRPVSKDDIMKEFPTVFDGQIRTMPGEVFKIVITEDAKLFCVNTPRTIPYAHMGPTKDELELLESQGVITNQTEPTDWCAPIVVARKKNSERIRLYVDFSPTFPTSDHWIASLLSDEELQDIQSSIQCSNVDRSVNRLVSGKRITAFLNKDLDYCYVPIC